MGPREIFTFFVMICLSGVKATGLEQSYCTDLKPQNSLDIKHLMGMWYGVEIITHLRDDDDVTIYDTCPVIHLSETTYETNRGAYSRDDYVNSQSRGVYSRDGYINSPSRGVYSRDDYLYSRSTESHIAPGSYGYKWSHDQYDNEHPGGEYRHLRLYWQEANNDIEYYLKFNNSRKGFWVSSGPQHSIRGAMLSRQYNQFAGTVQVIKAVVDHLVLTFCQRLPETQLFTAILSRDPLQLTRQEIHSIHNLLSRRDLSTSTIRKVCRNGAKMETLPISSLIIFTVISIATHFGFTVI